MIHLNTTHMEPASFSTFVKFLAAYFTALIVDNFIAIVDKYAVLLLIGLFAMLLDWSVACIKCKVVGEEITHEKAHSGFWKKMGYLLMMVFGVFVDYTLPVIANKSGYDFSHNVPVGAFTIWYVYITESVSIINSFKQMKIKVPKVLRDIFTKASTENE